MSRIPNPTGAQQRAYFLRPEVQRWMRHDAHRWIRHDAARFLPPGMDPADVYPALARQRAAEDAAFAAEIAKGYRVLAALREEVAQVKAEMLRRRLAEQTKYSPSQPRVPAGNPRGGQWTDRSGGGGSFGGFGGGDGTESGDGGGGGDATADTPLAFQADDSTGSLDDWNKLLDRLANDGSNPKPIPNADSEGAADNLQDVNARRGGISNWFPGASVGQQSRLDQAIARSENALTQIRQYDPDWQPREQSLTSPGSVEGAIGRAEARATEAETRLDQLRTGIGGNRGPLLDPSPRGAPLSPRVFDGGAWIDAYRSINNAPDLFGRPMWSYDRGAVAAGEIDGKLYFGVNSTAPGYSSSDLNRALDARDTLVGKYPKEMGFDNIGKTPNDSLFHAESTILLRAAKDNGGSLANRSMEIYVDREVCDSCGKTLTKLGLELGDPYVVFIERDTGLRNEMWNGKWLSGRYK
jgi:hypothetical protein